MENQSADFGNNPQVNPYPNQAVPSGNVGSGQTVNYQISAQTMTPAEAHYVSSQPNIQVVAPDNVVAHEPIVGLYERLQKDAQVAEQRALSSSVLAGVYGLTKPTEPSNVFVEILISLFALFAASSLLLPLFGFDKTIVLIVFFTSMLLLIVGFLLVAAFKVRSWASSPAVVVFVCQLIILLALVLHSFGYLNFELKPVTDYLQYYYL